MVAAAKLERDKWDVDYLHTGRHSAIVVRKSTQPETLYIIDSSLQSAYEIPARGYLWSIGNHAYATHASLPPLLPHLQSPVIFEDHGRMRYIEKGASYPLELMHTNRRRLIESPIDAISDRPNLILLLRKRANNANCFPVFIILDLKIMVVHIRGHGFPLKSYFLVDAIGRPDVYQLARLLIRLYSFHEQYPRQLSGSLYRRFTRVVLTLLQQGLAFKILQSTTLILFCRSLRTDTRALVTWAYSTESSKNGRP